MLRYGLIRLTVGTLLLAAFLPAGGLSSRAQAFEQRTTSWKVAPVAGPQYVAVFGEVGRPGVYELNGSIPSLTDLLTMSRGTNSTASGSIRVFRSGRTFQYFLTPKLNVGLQANDLVIVDSKHMVDGRRRTNGSADVQTRAGFPETATTVPSQEIVQLGLVNLISRPVVLDIPASDANLAKVLALLHQPIREKSEITVFKPGSGVQSIVVEEALAAQLISGTVLLFDPLSVNPSVLPALPATVNSVPDTALSPGNSVLDSSTLPATTPNLVAVHPDQAAATNPSYGITAALPIEEPRQPTNLMENSASSAAPLEPPQTPATAPRSAGLVAGSKPVASHLWTILGVLAGVFLCGLTALMRRRVLNSMRPVEKSTRPAISEADEAVDSLAGLISGALPIVEEPLQLPSGTEVFGRVRLEPPHRVDIAHALAGPHFAPEPVRPAAAEATVASAAPGEPASDRPPGRRTRVDGAHPRSGAGILDRALASFEGGHP